VSAYGYKLQSAYPNHTYKVPASWGAANRATDMDSFCGKCHPTRVDASMPVMWTQVPGYDGNDPNTDQPGAVYATAGTYHNHPTACTYCHGNPLIATAAGVSSKDFPHTSGNSSLLKQYPDGLCINCHTSLP